MDILNEKVETKCSIAKISAIGTLIVVGLCTGAVLTVKFINTAPPNFPIGTDIVIDEGLTVREISELLQKYNVVRSSQYVYVALLAQGKETSVQAGSYRFPERLSADDVSDAITRGDYRSPLIKITLPEGFRARDIVNYFPTSIGSFDENLFALHEGKLFPDTYFISPDASPEDIQALLLKTFYKKLEHYENEIKQSKFSLDDVIILASIIEREAKDVQSKKIVSGILQNRLNHNMPLQVDATFDYILGKASGELTQDDLAIDSPFNTYTHTGLPPSPISNPGIEAIEAVLYPTNTVYFYYLTAPDGTFHYARTFDEHKRNKAKYLK